MSHLFYFFFFCTYEEVCDPFVFQTMMYREIQNIMVNYCQALNPRALECPVFRFIIDKAAFGFSECFDVFGASISGMKHKC